LLLSGEKVTQKHFHTAAPFCARQCESALRAPAGRKGPIAIMLQLAPFTKVKC